MKLPLFKSLRFKMPAVVLLGVVPLMSVAILVASNRGTQAIRKEAEENLALKADLLSEVVSRWNEMNVLALENLSEQPDILNMNPNRQKPLLANLVDNYEHFYLAMTVKLDGYNLARSDNFQSSKYYGDRNYFKAALQGQKISYQTLIGRTNKRLALCMSAPLEGQQQIVGVTVICTDLKAVAEQVGKLRFGETGYAFVVDSNGNVLAHPNPKYISGSSLQNFSNYPPVKNIQKGSNQRLTFVDDLEIKWFSYSKRLNNGWTVVVLQQEQEFLSNERQFRTIAFIIAATAILGTIAVTFIIANRLIEPISDLTSAATKISDGQLEQNIAIKREDELGILAQSFNDMANRLSKFFDILKKQIDQRSLEAEQAKQATEVANKNREKLLSNISGELQISLKTILDFTKILENDHNLLSRQIQILDIIEQNGTYLLTLINDILDFSTTDTLGIKLETKDLHLKSFLDGIIVTIQPWITDKSLQIKSQIDPNLPVRIQADEKRLRQILINLLSNAIKFTFQGGVKFKISLVEAAQSTAIDLEGLKKLRFEVIDTGVGISPDRLKKLFLPLEESEAIKNQSIIEGFSLTISRQLVNLMGGKLKAKSELGVGSTFWFDLIFPVTQIDESEGKNYLQKQAIIGYKGKKRKILIAEDKEKDRSLILNILKPLGFETIIANDGRQMLEIAANIKPDLIMFNLYMPVKSGFTSAKELGKIPELKRVPIIVLSSNNSMTEKFCKYLGCQGHLKKPIDRDELLAILKQFLGLNWTYEKVSPYPLKISPLNP